MAKISLTKLKLVPKETIKTFIWNEQEIEVKQYISIQDKLNMISEVLNLAADDNRFYYLIQWMIPFLWYSWSRLKF